MKKIIIAIIIIVLIVFAFFYFTRPVSAPVVPIDQVAEKLVSNTPTEKLYRISQADSKVEFKIGEILNGKPFTAIGDTNQIAGDVVVSNTDIKIGTLSIDAKTFKTDSRERNGAIARFILKSETAGNEFITFKPSTITGMPANITEGKDIPITVLGNLTIAGITKTSTFKVNINIANDKVTATADTTIKRSDYGLTIPNVPFVASVDETFPVQVTLVANLVK